MSKQSVRKSWLEHEHRFWCDIGEFLDVTGATCRRQEGIQYSGEEMEISVKCHCGRCSTGTCQEHIKHLFLLKEESGERGNIHLHEVKSF